MENISQVKHVISEIDTKLVAKISVVVAALLFFGWTAFGFHKYFYIMNTSSSLLSGLFLASIYLSFAIGLNLTYKLLGFANFAHAEYFVVGAYVGVGWSYTFESQGLQGHDYVYVVLLAFLASGIVAVIGDLLIFKPLRNRNATAETLMITSIGWGILIRNIISIFFGGDSLYFRLPQQKGSMPTIWLGRRNGHGYLHYFTNIKYNYDKYVTFAIYTTIFFIGLLIIFMEYTKLGKALRATSDNRDLAESSGINTELMILITWFIGGGLAGVAGAIFVAKTPVIPYSGFLYLLPAFAVVVLGGIGSIRGSIVAALIIGFTEDLSKMYLSGQEKINAAYFHFKLQRTGLFAYSIVFPFIILILVIFLKPTGIYGEE